MMASQPPSYSELDSSHLQPPTPPFIQKEPQTTVQFIPASPQRIIVVPQNDSDHHSLPTHNIIITTIVTIGCALLNITSLVIGIPAMMCAIVAYRALYKQQYYTTKGLGYLAVVLSIVNIIYTGIITAVIVATTIQLYCKDRIYSTVDYYRKCD